MPVQYKAILFDLDGTLVNSKKMIFGAFNHVAENFLGRQYVPEEIVSFFGPSEEQTWAELLSEDQFEEGIKAYYAYYLQKQEDIVPYEGIPSLLSQLANRQPPLAIVTGRGKRTTQMTVEYLKWRPFFSSIITNGDIQQPKPHPESVLLACQQLGVTPQEALMIGDSPMDIEAGRSAGAVTAAAFWGTFGPRENLEKTRADFEFETPSDLQTFLLNHTLNRIIRWQSIWRTQNS